MYIDITLELAVVKLNYITIYLNNFQKITFIKTYRYIVMSPFIWFRFD